EWDPDTISATDATALLGSIADLLARAARFTGTARRSELTVIVYRHKSDLLAVTCAPGWIGGAFDGTLRLVHARGAAQGGGSRALAHETLHAQLDEWVAQKPKWFHEGLAQYFAGERNAGQLQTWAF